MECCNPRNHLYFLQGCGPGSEFFLFSDCGSGSGSDYGEGVASHYHVGVCVTTSKEDKIVPEKIKNLLKIFSNKRG